MLKKILFIVILGIITVILGIITVPSYTQVPQKSGSKPTIIYKSAYDSLLLEGIKAIDARKLDDAVHLLNQAIAINPNNWEAYYEKALAYYQAKEYDSTIAILEPFIETPEVNHHFFQVLGSSYDIKQNYEKSEEIYTKGLERFPNAGNIYMELGIHWFELKEPARSVYYWHKGLDVEPDYDNNYYWLSRYLFYNYDYVWAIMYGEVFMNLSDAPMRLDDISNYIDGAFGYGFYHQIDSVTTDIKFSSINIMAKNLKEIEDLPFELAYQIVMKEAADALLPKKKSQLKISDIYKIRQAFIEIWYKDGWNKRYSNPLFDLHKKLIANGHFDTYHYWLLNSVRKIESQEWLKNNNDKLHDFGKFMVKNKLKINKGNYFSRDKYSRGY